MPCNFPISGFRGPNGSFVSTKAKSLAGVPLTLPCGRCAGCRIEKVRDWGTRIAHEATLHEENCFVTLTYSDELLPDDYSINKRDLQLFFKRLRKSLQPKKIRYYACGEYGDKGGRPHYHAIIFGYRPQDAVQWRQGRNYWNYRSETLETLWGLGHVEFSDVTSANGSYVAGYALKKMRGSKDPDKYLRAHPITGEVHEVLPEFAVMSTKPGIGQGWFDQFEMDAFPSDFVTIDGKRRPVPKAYVRKLKERFQHKGANAEALLPVDDAKLYADRKKRFALEHQEDNTQARRDVREELTRLQIARFDNSYDREN